MDFHKIVRNERLQFRCSKDEKEMIETYCKARNITIADFVRGLALAYIRDNKDNKDNKIVTE